MRRRLFRPTGSCRWSAPTPNWTAAGPSPEWRLSQNEVAPDLARRIAPAHSTMKQHQCLRVNGPHLTDGIICITLPYDLERDVKPAHINPVAVLHIQALWILTDNTCPQVCMSGSLTMSCRVADCAAPTAAESTALLTLLAAPEMRPWMSCSAPSTARRCDEPQEMGSVITMIVTVQPFELIHHPSVPAKRDAAQRARAADVIR